MQFSTTPNPKPPPPPPHPPRGGGGSQVPPPSRGRLGLKTHAPWCWRSQVPPPSRGRLGGGWGRMAPCVRQIMRDATLESFKPDKPEPDVGRAVPDFHINALPLVGEGSKAAIDSWHYLKLDCAVNSLLFGMMLKNPRTIGDTVSALTSPLPNL